MNHFSSQSFGMGQTAVDLHANPETRQRVESTAECNLWLPYAAECYKLSRKLEDYVLVPVPGLITDVPNTNGDSVTLREFMKFNPDHGQQAFKTFRGKPTFTEHDNKNIVKAKGVILDVFMRPIKGFGGSKYYKLVMLLAYDRTKDPLLVNSILSGENNAYSVGFYYKSYACSICNQTIGQNSNSQPCEHTMPRKGTYMLNDGTRRLAYRQCQDVLGFECSSVGNPAFVTAIGPHVMNPGMRF